MKKLEDGKAKPESGSQRNRWYTECHAVLLGRPGRQTIKIRDAGMSDMNISLVVTVSTGGKGEGEEKEKKPR